MYIMVLVWKYVCTIPELNAHLFYCRKSCAFRAYTLPRNQTYWCLQRAVVSTCPEYFSTWKLHRDCEQSPSSWVYHNKTVYRNMYCAVCNLGDAIVEANIEGFNGDFSFKDKFTKAVFEEWRPGNTSSYQELVHVDVNSNECCVKGVCLHNSQILWGAVIAGTMSRALPFNISLQDGITSLNGSFQSTDLKLDYFCSATPSPSRGPIGAAGVRKVYQAQIVVHKPTYAQFFFSDVKTIPRTRVIDTDWITVNDSAAICSDGRLRIAKHKLTYETFQLSRHIIKVMKDRITKK